ncbi:unnamed protein product [Mytilus coruscus]|uniref:Tesmin/TSO1-like CXC domain-containing protein n=1 Tax=Mytilus coruscus TaxID=42192 RepID=A0A6J8AQ50_MYTCO|nr:unnamed protein product [Mytilus coruscus]
MFDNTLCESDLDKHLAIIKKFRESIWERVVSEVEMIPNAEALKLHWLRCCWVMQYWKQSSTTFMSLPDIKCFGWNIINGDVTVVWDSEWNVQTVNDTIQWYTKGCSCKSGCTTLRCSCKKLANKYCSPDDQDSDLKDSEPEENISYDSDSETDNKEIAMNTSRNTTTNYINYWDTFENDIFALPTD